MKKYFTFEITILDDKDMHRRFRVSNFQSTTRVRPFCTSMPIGLKDGWNQIQFNLCDFTRRAYGTNYIETTRMQVHANCRIRRIYFANRLYSEDELPEDFKLFFPVRRRKCVREEMVPKKPSIVSEPPSIVAKEVSVEPEVEKPIKTVVLEEAKLAKIVSEIPPEEEDIREEKEKEEKREEEEEREEKEEEEERGEREEEGREEEEEGREEEEEGREEEEEEREIEEREIEGEEREKIAEVKETEEEAPIPDEKAELEEEITEPVGEPLFEDEDEGEPATLEEEDTEVEAEE